MTRSMSTEHSDGSRSVRCTCPGQDIYRRMRRGRSAGGRGDPIVPDACHDIARRDVLATRRGRDAFNFITQATSNYVMCRASPQRS